MAARATWKGILQISLVNVPIRVYPATDTAATISFNQLHEPCGSRIQQKRYCPKCQRFVDTAEIARAFEFERDRYVTVTDDELDQIRPPSTRIVALAHFADVRDLDPSLIDRTYYLAPDGPRATTAYAVMRDALRSAVGVGKVALYGREYLVAVRAVDGALVLHTLHHAAELRPIAAVLDELPPPGPRDQVQLARKVIAALHVPTIPLDTFTDEYKSGVRRLIDSKIAGEAFVTTPTDDTPAIADLRQALLASLERARAARPRPLTATRSRQKGAA